MNLHKWLAAVIVILALVGCIQVATGPGQAPYSRESGADTRGGVDGGGGGAGM